MDLDEENVRIQPDDGNDQIQPEDGNAQVQPDDGNAQVLPDDGNAQIQSDGEDERLAMISDEVFRNGLIVEEISKNLNLAEFRTFRMLRRSCHLDSKSVWKKRACVRFNQSIVTDRSLANFNNFLVQRYGTNEAGRIAADIPFQKFSFVGWTAATDDLRTFVTLCANQVRDLEIVDFHSDLGKTAEDFIGTVRMLIAHSNTLHVRRTRMVIGEEFFIEVCEVGFPNLTQLRLSFACEVDLVFLLRFPNLKKLVVSDTIPYPHNWTRILVQRSIRARMSASTALVLALTSLDVSRTAIECCHEDVLVTANFPLRHLALNISGWKHIDLANVLNHYGSNLVTLKLSRENRNPPCKLIPLDTNFENLIELNLFGNVEDSLDFLMHTPVLSRLKIYQIDLENPSFLGAAVQVQTDIVQSSRLLLGLPQFSISSLREFRTDRMIAVASRNTLRQWMPNLIVFEVPGLD